MPVVNSTVNYTATLVPPDATSPTYAWSLPSGGGSPTSGSGSSFSVTWGNTPGTYPLSLTVTIGGTCASSDSDTTNIIVTALTPSCAIPTSVVVSGQQYPIESTSEIYTAIGTGGNNSTWRYHWSVTGSTPYTLISTNDSTSNTMEIAWGLDGGGSNQVLCDVYCQDAPGTTTQDTHDVVVQDSSVCNAIVSVTINV